MASGILSGTPEGEGVGVETEYEHCPLVRVTKLVSVIAEMSTVVV
jgi:hypothetical protein